MLRVGDLQRSIDFYTGVMGMKLAEAQKKPASMTDFNIPEVTFQSDLPKHKGCFQRQYHLR